MKYFLYEVDDSLQKVKHLKIATSDMHLVFNLFSGFDSTPPKYLKVVRFGDFDTENGFLGYDSVIIDIADILRLLEAKNV